MIWATIGDVDGDARPPIRAGWRLEDEVEEEVPVELELQALRPPGTRRVHGPARARADGAERCRSPAPLAFTTIRLLEEHHRVGHAPLVDDLLRCVPSAYIASMAAWTAALQLGVVLARR